MADTIKGAIREAAILAREELHAQLERVINAQEKLRRAREDYMYEKKRLQEKLQTAVFLATGEELNAPIEAPKLKKIA